MYCTGSINLSKNLTLRPAVSNSYLSSFNSSCIENIPEKSGFWRVAKVSKFFMEDYYV